jgi:hypothetical protein
MNVVKGMPKMLFGSSTEGVEEQVTVRKLFV